MRGEPGIYGTEYSKVLGKGQIEILKSLFKIRQMRRYGSCISEFSHCCGHNLDKKQPKGRSICFGHSMSERAWCLDTVSVRKGLVGRHSVCQGGCGA